MLGAILGDIVGSPFEFDHNNYKHKDFPLLSEKSHFTDDTVMTAAVAVGLIDGKGLPERTFCAVQHEIRSQSSSSRTSVQQAIIYSLKMLKKPGNTLFSGLFLCPKFCLDCSVLMGFERKFMGL